jgi:large subunit ribosomal protein L1
MDSDKGVENVSVLLTEVARKKPSDVKGTFVRSVSVSSTMGPGVWVNYREGE